MNKDQMDELLCKWPPAKKNFIPNNNKAQTFQVSAWVATKKYGTLRFCSCFYVFFLFGLFSRLFGEVLWRLPMCQLQAELTNSALERCWNINSIAELPTHAGVIFVFAKLEEIWEMIGMLK